MQRKIWLRSTQIVVTVSLIGLLLHQVEWADLQATARNLHWHLIALSAGLVLVSHLVNVARWQFILQVHTPGYSRLLAFYGAGLFGNNFLPTGIGGDGIRAALLSRTVPLSQALLSVGLDRALGLVALWSFAIPGLWLGLPPGLWLSSSRLIAILNPLRILPAVAFSLVGAGTLGLVAWRRWPRGASDLPAGDEELVETGCEHTTTVRFSAFLVSAGAFIRRPGWLRVLGAGLGLSVISQLGVVAAYWSVLNALDAAVPPAAAIWLVIAASASLLLPITISGLGLQEGAFVMLLTRYGVPTTTALGVAVVIRMFIVFFGLLGGLTWLRQQWANPSGGRRSPTLLPPAVRDSLPAGRQRG